ncbi:contact-dependent growth inhibition system immunity protein [Mycolicibacterium sp.]|uniref:contact-dependent growth inhibition system immunity protein n=1 Tax=Mycolicibacterium sp. TaxID=2320850 RepID=UPI00355DF479
MTDSPVSWDLDQFFGAYFHQDWVLEADDWEGVVDSYVNGASRTPELLRGLATEIESLRVANTDTALEQLMDKIGVNYDPQPLAYKDWLHQIAERLRQHAAGVESGSAS